MATKWYWALDIGAIEAISAIDRHSARVPVHDRKKPYIKDTGPPFRKAAPRVLVHVSQVPKYAISWNPPSNCFPGAEDGGTECNGRDDPEASLQFC